jgi:hypothetical protein
MPSNLPPGVSDSDLPGNRPEDQELDGFVLTIGQLEDLQEFRDLEKQKTICEQSSLLYIVEDILEQFEESYVYVSKHKQDKEILTKFD